jgi:hypothetical protein
MSDINEYLLSDVDAAERRIRAEVPGVLVARGDYDFALSVADAGKTMGFIVYRPLRRNDEGRITQSAVVGDVSRIIERLKAISAPRSSAFRPSRA